MAIPSSASPSSISSPYCYSSSEPARFVRFPSITVSLTALKQHPSRFSLSSCLNSSKPSGAGGSVSPGDDDLEYELQHGFAPPQRRKGASVFVKLLLNATSLIENSERRKKLAFEMKGLTAAGVEGVVMEVWWGNVEETPGNYDWRAYWDIVAMARDRKLKVRAVMAFHQCCTVPGTSGWIALPRWVLSEMDKNPDLAYCDRFGKRSREYISLGCDILPVLKGRSPVQIYSDFMRNFRDTFREFLGGIITEIQVGLGPAGELRYALSPSQRLRWHWRFDEIGEFQCYDRYMLASLRASAQDAGQPKWGTGGPSGAEHMTQRPEEIEFFKSTGVWRTIYGHFFLEWYSGMLLLHGERLCIAAKTIFHGTGVNIAAKVAGIFWHYHTLSHPCELTAGYYNTSTRDGYLPIIQMFGRHGITLCCECFELVDQDAKKLNLTSSPEGLVKQLLLAAKACDVPLVGETSDYRIDNTSQKNVLEMFMLYSDGLTDPSISLNFGKMSPRIFGRDNWIHFCNFAQQMNRVTDFQSKLNVYSVLATTETFVYS
ncbi:beta-amylase 1, chloroplastic-like [Telopea speciosissima]|uniref:beta-amylase 1, chloroplastic-like n=1 Tax=Telopea speciosissima TaxID=54955 RepID=UPI001CC69427|nr:beta-amylase 1, chloroplastic-like [Telopea speciosissima]